MNIDAHALADEVRKLCRRDAARHPHLRQRIGPQLGHIAGVTESDSPAQIRLKLASLVERCMKDEPEEAAVTLLAALGLYPSAPEGTLDRRLVAVGRSQYMGVRTVYRRLPEAIDLFVQAATRAAWATSRVADVGYVVGKFDGTMTCDGDGDGARFIQRRSIEVVRDQLPVIQCWFGVEPSPLGGDEPAFTVDIVSGGVSCEASRKDNVVECRIEVGRTLQAGQTWEFEIAFELPPGQPMAPHYVVQPLAPFAAASLTVRFDPRRVPVRVWRVDAARPREVDNCPSEDRLLPPDPSACVRATFHDVREGRAYGIAWEWA